MPHLTFTYFRVTDLEAELSKNLQAELSMIHNVKSKLKIRTIVSCEEVKCFSLISLGKMDFSPFVSLN